MIRAALAVCAALLLGAAAPEPSERLPDPAAEDRARDLFKEIRCVVCQNESIDDSEAALAQDLRRLVREQVGAGRSDGEVRAYLVDRYGEFILLRPTFSPANWLLWAVPFLIVLAGVGGLWLSRRGRAGAAEVLTAEEEARLQRVVAEVRGAPAQSSQASGTGTPR